MKMVTKLLCYLLFLLIETLIISGSVVVVVGFYLPFVAIKGIVLTLRGKATTAPNTDHGNTASSAT